MRLASRRTPRHRISDGNPSSCVRSRRAFWPARSAGMNVHARPRWSVSQPGDQNRATTSHLQQNPRKWRSTLHQVDHTQLDGFPSEMRCRGVVLLASRISVPSPATPCTLFTPNGAPCCLISRICFLPALRRSQCRSMPLDGKASTSIYSSPRFRTLTHCTPRAL
eukprot:scaffold9923_cov38-Phaeocystis_antarctica.AAC.4